jgi:hypothetical protein
VGVGISEHPARRGVMYGCYAVVKINHVMVVTVVQVSPAVLAAFLGLPFFGLFPPANSICLSSLSLSLFCALVVPSHRTRMSGGRGCPVVVSCSSSPGSRSGWRPPAASALELIDTCSWIDTTGHYSPGRFVKLDLKEGNRVRYSSTVTKCLLRMRVSARRSRMSGEEF